MSAQPVTLNTAFLLASMYNGRPAIPLETVRTDWFSHLTKDQFIKKMESGEIALLFFQMDWSQKAPQFINTVDLAAYVERTVAEASECAEQWLCGVKRLFTPERGHASAVRRLFPVSYDASAHVQTLPRVRIKEQATGVYFLFSENECVYVGQSRNVHRRVASHLRDVSRGKVFDSYSWLVFDEADLDAAEGFYIRTLKPRLNRAGLGGSRASEAPL